jgi:hypothetical protein
LQFHHYLLAKAWIQSKNTRARLEYDSLIWESFAGFVCKKNLKPGPYMIDTIKHLLVISNGVSPAFRLINGNEVLMPTKTVETAYIEDYGLEYAPIIIGPSIFNLENSNSPIYYSLSYPTLLEGTPTIRHAPSIISELQETKTLMLLLESVLKTENLVSFYDSIKNLKFQYFHDGKDRFGELLNSSEIEKHDPLIHKLLTTEFAGKDFPTHGPFFRGCIQIAKINK